MTLRLALVIFVIVASVLSMLGADTRMRIIPTTTTFTRQLLTNEDAVAIRSKLEIAVVGTNLFPFDTNWFTVSNNTVSLSGYLLDSTISNINLTTAVTEDINPNTPEVPLSPPHTNLWRRIPHPSDTTNQARLYVHNPNATNHPIFGRWELQQSSFFLSVTNQNPNGYLDASAPALAYDRLSNLWVKVTRSGSNDGWVQITSISTNTGNTIGAVETEYTRHMKRLATADAWRSGLGLGYLTNGLPDGTNITYIAYRTDGVDGIGTAMDPRDGSTPDKLDAIYSNAPAWHALVHYPSLLYQSQPAAFEGTNFIRRYEHKDGQVYLGLAGPEATKITLNTNTPIGGRDGQGLAFWGEGPYGKTNVTWKGLWFDGNFTNFFAHNLLSNAFSAVATYGENLLMEDCKITGMWGDYGSGSLVGKEGFPVFLTTSVGLGYNANMLWPGNNVIRRTTLINDIPLLTNGVPNRWAYVNALNAYGRLANGSNFQNFQTNYIPGVVEDCLIINNAGCSLLAAAGSDIIRGNRVFGSKLNYQDTWRGGRVIIENNYVITSNTSIIQLSIDTNSATMVSEWGPFDIRNNDFTIITNGHGSAADASDGFIYVETEGGGMAYNATEGRTNWVGIVGMNISGNKFVGDGYTPGINGVYRDLEVHNNHFEKVGIALLTGAHTTNISFTHNTVKNSGFGVYLQPANYPMDGADISDNTFDTLRRFALIAGGVNNLRFNDNIVRQYGLQSPASPEQGIAVEVGTNVFTSWLSQGATPPGTNFMAHGNTFRTSTNDFTSAPYRALYSIRVNAGQRNVSLSDNFDNSELRVSWDPTGTGTLSGYLQEGFSVLWNNTNAPAAADPHNSSNLLGSFKVNFIGTNTGYIKVYKAP